MLLAHSMPAVTNIALTGGTWLTADTWRALIDGRPSRPARIQRSGTVTLTVTLNRTIPRRVIALLGLNLPSGTAITADGTSTVSHWTPSTNCAWLLPGDTTPTQTFAITIAGTGLLQIGEIAIMPATDVPIEPDWSVELIDPTESTRDRGSQLTTAARVPYRRLTAHLQAHGINTMRTWEYLRMNLTKDRRCCAIPRRDDPLTLHRRVTGLPPPPPPTNSPLPHAPQFPPPPANERQSCYPVAGRKAAAAQAPVSAVPGAPVLRRSIRGRRGGAIFKSQSRAVGNSQRPQR